MSPRTLISVVTFASAAALVIACGAGVAERACDGSVVGSGDCASPDPSPAPPDAAPVPGTRVPKLHRPQATCPASPPPQQAPSPDGEGSDDCRSHAECARSGRNGRCTDLPGSIGRRYTCFYDACNADAECRDGEACACAASGGGTNGCLAAECRVDADCGAAGYCSPTFNRCGHYAGMIGMYCHTTRDECIDDEDCKGPSEHCSYVKDAKRWKCSRSC